MFGMKEFKALEPITWVLMVNIKKLRNSYKSLNETQIMKSNLFNLPNNLRVFQILILVMCVFVSGGSACDDSVKL